MLKNVTK